MLKTGDCKFVNLFANERISMCKYSLLRYSILIQSFYVFGNEKNMLVKLNLAKNANSSSHAVN